jgi:hypothetical protein
MRPILSTFALLSMLALPMAAHADTFDFSAVGSGGGFNGTGTFVATNDGGGHYTITGISGTGISGLVAPGGFDNNDNLLFPTLANALVDMNGFSFTDTQGNTDFTIDIFSTGGMYDAYFVDSDNFSATVPVTFMITNTTSVVPEPSSLLLLATGMAGLTLLARRRLFGEVASARVSSLR